MSSLANPLHQIKLEPMSPEVLKQSLSYLDLTEDGNNPKHAIKIILDEIITALSNSPDRPQPQIIRYSPITTIQNNFDRLRFPLDNPGRSSTYTRYVDQNTVLRAHVSAMVPPALDKLSKTQPQEALLVMPGLAYRRDVSDKTHSGVFHQADIWQISQKIYTRMDLLELINLIFQAVLPGYEPIIYEAKHPYTLDGVEVYAKIDGQLIEILEAGLAHPEVLAGSGLDPKKYTGLALGTGLDRLLMVRKKLPDIRLIRAKDPRIVKQMTNLDPYIPVSSMPAISRDMSYSVPKDHGEEDISEAIRVALGEAVEILESVEILGQTDYQDLPVVAKEKLGIRSGQKNVLVRVVLRSLDQNLTKEYANILLDQIYLKINYGEKGYKNVV